MVHVDSVNKAGALLLCSFPVMCCEVVFKFVFEFETIHPLSIRISSMTL